MFKNINILLRTLALAGLVGVAGWWTLFLKAKLNDRDEELNSARAEVSSLVTQVENRDREINDLGTTIDEQGTEIETLVIDVAEKEAEIETLDVALTLLKVNTRVAKLEVLSQGAPADDPDAIRTVLKFTELGPDGEIVGEPRELVVQGKTIYVETLIVKFRDDYVEKGDVLRGTSLCLFKSVFGENQKPSDGVPIDPVGQQPLVYRGDETPNALHLEIWRRFWDYANDAELREQLGIRAIHGEAPFIETRPGKTYTVELRSSDGLSIRSD